MRIRIPATPPHIDLVTPNEYRPKWSVMIPVYNCSEFLIETINSVLVQGIPEIEMQIEVVDDASTDTDVEALVYSLGKGRVKYYRQNENVGSLWNFQTCLNRAKGRLVHLLHGDDRVKLGYYDELNELFIRYPQIGAAFCGFEFIDEMGNKLSEDEKQRQNAGVLENWLERLAERNCIQYPAITVRREVYEDLGTFYGSTGGEDWEMWLRIACKYDFGYTPKVLAEYRQHNSSITANKFVTGETLKDIKRVILIAQTYLPEEKKATVMQRSKRYYAWYGLHIAFTLWKETRQWKDVHRQIKQSLLLYKNDISMYPIIFKLYLKMFAGRL